MEFPALRIVCTIELGIFCREITASQIALFFWAYLIKIRPRSVSGPEKFVFLSQYISPCQNGWQAQKKIENLCSKYGP